jgi:hypothetical protein
MCLDISNLHIIAPMTQKLLVCPVVSGIALISITPKRRRVVAAARLLICMANSFQQNSVFTYCNNWSEFGGWGELKMTCCCLGYYWFEPPCNIIFLYGPFWWLIFTSRNEFLFCNFSGGGQQCCSTPKMGAGTKYLLTKLSSKLLIKGRRCDSVNLANRKHEIINKFFSNTILQNISFVYNDAVNYNSPCTARLGWTVNVNKPCTVLFSRRA